MNTKQTVKGFTIIEVVLVLAIAGLIFLMVFVALPALQSGQRDTARRSDVSSVAAAVTDYSANNRGRVPTTAQLKTQLGAESATAATTNYANLSNNSNNVVVASNDPAGNKSTTDGLITVYPGLKCNPNPPATLPAGNVSLVAGSARQFATVTRIEASNGAGYCLDS